MGKPMPVFSPSKPRTRTRTRTRTHSHGARSLTSPRVRQPSRRTQTPQLPSIREIRSRARDVTTRARRFSELFSDRHQDLADLRARLSSRAGALLQLQSGVARDNGGGTSASYQDWERGSASGTHRSVRVGGSADEGSRRDETVFEGRRRHVVGMPLFVYNDHRVDVLQGQGEEDSEIDFVGADNNVVLDDDIPETRCSDDDDDGDDDEDDGDDSDTDVSSVSSSSSEEEEQLIPGSALPQLRIAANYRRNRNTSSTTATVPVASTTAGTAARSTSADLEFFEQLAERYHDLGSGMRDTAATFAASTAALLRSREGRGMASERREALRQGLTDMTARINSLVESCTAQNRLIMSFFEDEVPTAQHRRPDAHLIPRGETDIGLVA